MKLLKLDKVWNVVHHHSPKSSVGLKEDFSGQHLFEDKEADDVWLKFVGQQGWIVFTQDRKFHKAGFEPELSAIKQYKVGCFYIWGASASREEKALIFLKALNAIREAIQATPKPFIYEVAKTGRLTQIPIP